MNESTLSNLKNPLTANFIGCGKLGKTFAALLSKNNLIQIDSILCSSLKASQLAVDFCKQGIACDSFQKFNPAQIYLFCTPDDQIENLCTQLLSEHQPQPNAIFLHFSGSLSSLVFLSAKNRGYLTGVFTH
jgi:hypothetical protein